MLRRIRTNYAYGISVSRDIGTQLQRFPDETQEFTCCGPTVYHLPVSADCFVGLMGKWVNVIENVN
ncbi:hypothetical protein ALC57_17288 [Trachymyrmex cornetzi]|uniref:Uncharacterized protein n=1 Tax=Trachymyrmex cornetzi TaxID=471704 RepID=A0A195DCS1_9HYME|nr:hypothetical protein ALC57_17288 [Trachymyrmex cornetzi]